MTQKQFDALKHGDVVRILKYPEDGINGYGRIRLGARDGKRWVVNMNMPFSGTVSAYFGPEEIESHRN